MRKIRKFFVAFGLSVALFLGTEQRETQAQGMPVIDIQGLLNSILSFLQDADLGGIFEAVNSWDIDITKYTELITQLQSLMQVYETFQRLGYLGEAITNTVTLFTTEMEFMNSIAMDMQNRGDGLSYVSAVMTCSTDFYNFCIESMDIASQVSEFVGNITSGSTSSSASQIIQMMTDSINQFQADCFVARNHFNSIITQIAYNSRARGVSEDMGMLLRTLDFI